MAAKGLICFGKRFSLHIRPAASLSPPSLLSSRRSVHVQVYDKNPDDQLRGTVVPDEVIGNQSDKYWGPHPQTGVFGPSADHKPAKGLNTTTANGGEDSILEQTSFFRPLEDLEKPTENSARLNL